MSGDSFDNGYHYPATQSLGRSSSRDFEPRPEDWWQLLYSPKHSNTTGQEVRAFDAEALLPGDSTHKGSKQTGESLDGYPERLGSIESLRSTRQRSSQHKAQKARRGISVKRYRATMNERFTDLYNAILGSRPRERSKLCNGQSGLSKVSNKLSIYSIQTSHRPP